MIEEVFRIESPFAGPYCLQRLRFGAGRPHLVVVAGLHGNELCGVHALNLVASALRAQRPAGTVDLFPNVNTLGIDLGTKRGPFQDRDLNRSFPGRRDGTAVERIAHAILEVTDADVCVDTHSGSPRVREIPQVRVPLAGREVELARGMNLPLVWRRPAVQLDAVGLVGSWRVAGRTAMRLMGGRGATLDKEMAEVLANGIRQLMAQIGMGPRPSGSRTLADVTHEGITSHRTSTGGYFVPEVRIGQEVKPGHLLGWVGAPLGGETLEEVRADRTGIVTTIRQYPMVHANELVVRVADTAPGHIAVSPIGLR